MIKIYLFRHGESSWNKNKDSKYSIENRNVSLTELGIQQAERNAEFLSDKGIEHIYSSNLKRAVETANILARKINVGITIDEDLQEFSSLYDDSVIGLTREEIKDKVGREEYERFYNEADYGMDWRMFEKSETKREVRERIGNVLNKICKTTPYGVIAISTHGAFLRELTRMYNFEDQSVFENCEVITAKYENEEIRLIKRIRNGE